MIMRDTEATEAKKLQLNLTWKTAATLEKKDVDLWKAT